MDQIVLLRRMTGEERLKQAFRLSDLTRDLAVANIKENLGINATEQNIQKELKKRLYVS